MIPIDDETILLNYCYTDDTYDRPGNTNIATAAMVTAYARIKLYSIIDEIESSAPNRVLYFDTDSVIFRDRPECGWKVPEIGDFLGDMTDEVAKDYGPAAYIDKFTSGGPKNYAYTAVTPNGQKIVTKVKGLNITSGIIEDLNFECVKEYAEKYRAGDKDAYKLFDQLQFRSTKLHDVYTSIFKKKYRAVSDKRVVLKEGERQTLPFGFI